MEKLISEWKKFKAKEIFDRFSFDNPNRNDIEIMLMSAIDEGYRVSKEYKDLDKDIRILIEKLNQLALNIGSESK